MNLVPLVDCGGLFLNHAAANASQAVTGVDVAKYDGQAIAVVYAKNIAGTNPTFDWKLQECATSGGGYTDTGYSATRVTTVTTTQIVPCGDIGERLQFVGGLVTVGGTATPTYDYAALLIVQPKYK